MQAITIGCFDKLYTCSPEDSFLLTVIFHSELQFSWFWTVAYLYIYIEQIVGYNH